MKDAAENLFAVFRIGAYEVDKFALGNHRHLHELILVEADDFNDLPVGFLFRIVGTVRHRERHLLVFQLFR